MWMTLDGGGPIDRRIVAYVNSSVLLITLFVANTRVPRRIVTGG